MFNSRHLVIMKTIQDKYDVFISYRRIGGYETAKHLFDLLSRDGYKVSFDIDTLRSGDFDTQLLSRIKQCKDFIIIVDKNAFDRTLDPSYNPNQDWLRCELSYALKTNKNIVPIFLSGVKGFPENLPDDIRGVCKKNGPEYSKYYFDDFYRRLKHNFLHQPSGSIRKRILAIASLASLALCGLFLLLYSFKHNTTVPVANQDNNQVNVPNVKEQMPTEQLDEANIRETFANAPELNASERADIVDLINAFTIDGEGTNGWDVFSDFTRQHKIIPLSKGVKSEPETSCAYFGLEFIAKLAYKGTNLDSDIFGQSNIQTISLKGPRMGPFLLSIDSGNTASFNLCDKADDIVEDVGFFYYGCTMCLGTSYCLYKKNDYWMVVSQSGGSGGVFFEWIVSLDKKMINGYLKSDLMGEDIFELVDSETE